MRRCIIFFWVNPGRCWDDVQLICIMFLFWTSFLVTVFPFLVFIPLFLSLINIHTLAASVTTHKCSWTSRSLNRFAKHAGINSDYLRRMGRRRNVEEEKRKLEKRQRSIRGLHSSWRTVRRDWRCSEPFTAESSTGKMSQLTKNPTTGDSLLRWTTWKVYKTNLKHLSKLYIQFYGHKH